jgi:hypothetical protein
MRSTTKSMLGFGLILLGFTACAPAQAPKPAPDSLPISQPMENQNDINDHLHLLWSEHGNRRNGIEWLGQHPEARPQVRAILEGKVEVWAGPAAMEALGRMSDPRDVAFLDSLFDHADYASMHYDIALANRLHDPTEDVVQAALLGLGVRGDEAARPLLLQQSASPSENIRYAAANAYGELGVAGSLSALKAWLAKEKSADVRGKLKEVLAGK